MKRKNGRSQKMNKHIARFLNDEKNYNLLSKSKINTDKSFSETMDKKFSREIIFSEDIKDEAYQHLIKGVNWWYPDIDVSKLPESRIDILINEGKIRFSVENFNYLVSSETGKHIDLIESDFDTYFKKKDELQLPEGATTKLLQSSDINLEDKQKLIKDIDEQSRYDLFDNENGLVQAIIDICLNNSLHLSSAFLENLFVYEEDRVQKIELLIKNASSLKKEEIYSLLTQLGDPYSKITISGYNISIHKSDLNIRLADTLERVNYISSKKEKIMTNKIQLFLKRQ